jgi:hypothetical protein
MGARANPGDGQRIEVQFIHEDEVIVVDDLDGSPNDIGDAVARTLEAANADDGQRELETALGGSASVISRLSRRP